MDSIVWILKSAAMKRYLRYGSIRLDGKICTLTSESALTRKKEDSIYSPTNLVASSVSGR